MVEDSNDLAKTGEEVESRQNAGGGILSNGQIKYLIEGGDDLTQNAEKQRRRKIRDNLQSAVADLALLSQLETKDLVRVLAPLGEADHAEDVTQGLYKAGLLSKKEAQYLNIADAADNPQLEMAMFQGVIGLMEAITYIHGPERAGALAEMGINQGQGRVSLALDEELEGYDLRLDPTPLTEKLDDYSIPK